MVTGTTIESNISALAWNMKVKEDELKVAIQDGLDESAQMGVNQERALLAPHAKRPQGLMSTVHWLPAGEYGRVFGPMTDSIQAMAIERGRKGFCAKGLRTGAPKKGDFFAKNTGAINIAYALHFQPVFGGEFIFRRCVGPAKAEPYVKPTRASMAVLFPKIMQTRIRTALNI